MATRLDVDSETIRQLVRFGLVGLFLTGVYALVYWPLATYWIAPLFAVLIAFIVAVTIGFVLHSRWSFKGHGQRENRRTKAKFLAVQTFGMLLNALFTWVLTGPVGGPTWWPLIPAVFITPLATFLLNRQWVFG